MFLATAKMTEPYYENSDTTTNKLHRAADGRASVAACGAFRTNDTYDQTTVYTYVTPPTTDDGTNWKNAVERRNRGNNNAIKNAPFLLYLCMGNRIITSLCCDSLYSVNPCSFRILRCSTTVLGLSWSAHLFNGTTHPTTTGLRCVYDLS